jgi:FKBP-type peptidyl-prolyl cis-trans isomerase (trigger factor)
LKANNIQIDNNVQVCLQRIDRIATAITVIHRAGDAIKAEADALFDQILSQNQHNRIPDCLLEYQRARNKYQEALQLSANDSLTEHKILDVDRRMNMLNTNI